MPVLICSLLKARTHKEQWNVKKYKKRKYNRTQQYNLTYKKRDNFQAKVIQGENLRLHTNNAKRRREGKLVEGNLVNTILQGSFTTSICNIWNHYTTFEFLVWNVDRGLVHLLHSGCVVVIPFKRWHVLGGRNSWLVRCVVILIDT